MNVIKASKAYRLYTVGDDTMIDRLKTPKWRAILVSGDVMEIKIIERLDDCEGSALIGSVKKAEEFIIKYKQP